MFSCLLKNHGNNIAFSRKLDWQRLQNETTLFSPLLKCLDLRRAALKREAGTYPALIDSALC